MFNDPIWNTFASLLLLVGVLAGILFYVKKIALKYSKNKFNATGVEILSKMPLQTKTNLYIIKVNNKKLLIGVTENSIQTLADLTDENDLQQQITYKNRKENIAPTKKTNIEDNLSFKAFLNQAFRRS